MWGAAWVVPARLRLRIKIRVKIEKRSIPLPKGALDN